MTTNFEANLKPWGATGELWVDGYAFDEADPPYYEPQNRINYEVTRLLPAFAQEFNDRLDSEDRDGNYTNDPGPGHLTWRIDNQRLSVYDDTNTEHRELAYHSELESHRNTDNAHDVTLEDARQAGDTMEGDAFMDNGGGMYERIDGEYEKYITASYLDNRDFGSIAFQNDGTTINNSADTVNVVGPTEAVSVDDSTVKLDSNHNHDDRYYTETEVDNLVEHGPDRPSFFETRTNDPADPQVGRTWMRTDIVQ